MFSSSLFEKLQSRSYVCKKTRVCEGWGWRNVRLFRPDSMLAVPPKVPLVAKDGLLWWIKKMLLWPPVVLGHRKSRTKTLRFIPNSPMKINVLDSLQSWLSRSWCLMKRWIVSDCYKPHTLRFGQQLAEHVLSSDPCGGVKLFHVFIQMIQGIIQSPVGTTDHHLAGTLSKLLPNY